jgi:hypothetical protein
MVKIVAAYTRKKQIQKSDVEFTILLYILIFKAMING